MKMVNFIETKRTTSVFSTKTVLNGHNLVYSSYLTDTILSAKVNCCFVALFIRSSV